MEKKSKQPDANENNKMYGTVIDIDILFEANCSLLNNKIKVLEGSPK